MAYFTLLTVSFKEQMFILIFDEVKFINLFFYESCLWNLIEAVFASLEITRIFFAFTSLGFYVYDLFCINICMQYEVWARVLSFFFFFFAYRYPVFPEPFIEMIVFPHWIASELLLKSNWPCMGSSNSGLYLLISVLLPIPCCLDYYGFIVSLEIR